MATTGQVTGIRVTLGSRPEQVAGGAGVVTPSLGRAGGVLGRVPGEEEPGRGRVSLEGGWEAGVGAGAGEGASGRRAKAGKGVEGCVKMLARLMFC